VRVKQREIPPKTHRLIRPLPDSPAMSAQGRACPGKLLHPPGSPGRGKSLLFPYPQNTPARYLCAIADSRISRSRKLLSPEPRAAPVPVQTENNRFAFATTPALVVAVTVVSFFD